MKTDRKARLDALESKLAGPKRVALFGHRAVGKTTLLSMFYRQASGGEVRGLRLAATDHRTREYFADKINRLECGEPAPATLAETELKVRLYREESKLDLILKDYQGEHTSLGSNEPIHEFFSDCDAVLLCLDPEAAHNRAERLARQQEIETLLERLIERSGSAKTDRPLALLVMKYDQILAREGREPELGEESHWRVDQLVEELYGMTRHALAVHVRSSSMFAVSAYGMGSHDGRPPRGLRPLGLDAPLHWLATELEALDADLVDWIWDLAPNEHKRLGRCVKAFAERYPRSTRREAFERRLAAARRRRRASALVKTAAAAALAAGGVFGYDYYAFQHMLAKERETGLTAGETERGWRKFKDEHPLLLSLMPAQAQVVNKKLAAWSHRASQTAAERELAELRTDTMLAADAGDPEATLARAKTFLTKYPESPRREEVIELARRNAAAAAERFVKADRHALDDLDRASAAPRSDPAELLAKARTYLESRPDTPLRPQFEARIEELGKSIDDRDFSRARDYSRQNRTNFPARLARYRDYLALHASGGGHVGEASRAIDEIETEWDDYAYKLIYNYAAEHPDDVSGIAEGFVGYLREHPSGRRIEAARAYLDWREKIASPRSYRVTLRRGRVEDGVGKYFSGGAPDLKVTIEVAGVVHGPSPVIPNSREPIWDYAFPKPIVWKLGDPVVVRIIDSDWSDSLVYTLKSKQSDKLAMRLLSGETRPAAGGATLLVFASDFALPVLPKP